MGKKKLMCGITGYISHLELNDERMLNSQNHRGPDSNGVYFTSVNNRNVFLGHTRLKIIDLSDCGSQPMKTRDENIVLIFNGEIYNYKELKDKYLKDYSFFSKSDTEVIIYLYQKFGIDFISKLNGDFAISIFDKTNKKLYLIKDRLGVKPLYYYLHNDSVIFASEIKSILASGINLELNTNELQKYFVFKYVPGNETLFHGIKRLKPGHYAEYDLSNSTFKEVCYWKLEKNKDYENLTYKDSQQILYGLLDDAVKLQLMSDVPVGNFFSGGLDSSTLAYFIKENSQIIHYSARKNKSDLKEEGSTSDYYYAEKLGKDWKLNLHPVDIGADETNIDLIKKTIFYSDDLIADGSQIPSFLITREAKSNSTVMLSGMGADELFYGYAGHQLSLLALYLDKLPKYISFSSSKILKALNPGKGKLKPYKRYLNKLGKYYNSGVNRYGFFNIVGDYEVSGSVVNSDGGVIDYFNKYFDDKEDVFNSITRFELDNFLVKNLNYMDRMCMANSTEGRVPFLDYRIVEFAYSIPRDYKLSSLGNGKQVLKDTMKAYLPDYIIKRRKAGFGMPLRSIFSDKKKVNELLDRDFFSSFRDFSLENIDSAVSKHISGEEENSALIYALISFQEWYKIFMCK